MNRRLIILLLICGFLASLYWLPRDDRALPRSADLSAVSPIQPAIIGSSLGQGDFAQLLERPLFDPSRRVAAQASSLEAVEMSRIDGWKLVGVFVGHGCMIKMADETVRFFRLNEEVEGVKLVSVDSDGAAFDWGNGVHRLDLQKPPSILVPAQ
jgi:hypothetical protein